MRDFRVLTMNFGSTSTKVAVYEGDTCLCVQIFQHDPQDMTGISTMDILERGIPKEQLCRDIAEMVAGNTLLLAYNAHFDLSFLFYLLLRNGNPAILKGKDKLDL